MTQLHLKCRNSSAAAARRGGVALLVVVSFSLLAACTAFALDLAMIAYHARQLQSACTAAALAGAVELMDDGGVGNADDDASDRADLAHDANARTRQRIVTAREWARQYAKANTVGGVPLALDFSAHDFTQGDVVAGWVDEPQSRGRPLAVWDGRGPVNSLLVRGKRSVRRGTPVAYWMGRLLGLDSVDLNAAARATVDQRVYGFRPQGHVRVPLLPIVIDEQLFADDGNLDQSAADRSAADGSKQTAGAEAPTSTPTPFTRLVLRIPLSGEQDEQANAWIARLGAPPRDLEVVRRQVEFGYDARDLLALGGEFSLANEACRTAPLHADAPQAWALATALERCLGERRIWLVGTADDTQDACQVSGFCAGRAVACIAGSTELQLVVQLCQLTTSTALVGAMGDFNPWLGKVLLTE